MSRRKRQHDRRIAAVQGDGSAASAPSAARRWILAGVTALLVARPLVTSDGGPWIGDGQPFAILWIVLALLWVLSQLGRPSFSARLACIDIPVVVFFAWWTWAALRGAVNGAPRPAFNELWEGVATLASYLLVRQLAPSGRETRAIVAVMIGVGLILATSALHQYFVSMPADRIKFEASAADSFREAGFYDTPAPESAQYRRFRDRLYSPEPYATFALTNSLAAYLAPWLVLAAGIGVHAAARGNTDRRFLWGVAGCVLILGGALYLTHSRAAWIGAIVGAALIVLTTIRSSGAPWFGRSARRWLSIGAVGATTAIVIGVASMEIWRPDLLERATRSFSFRIEYWRSTTSMIADRPLLGCGPGNFRDYYTTYKLPQASEEISDPHNFLFEIAAVAGIPALIAFAGITGLFFLRLFRRRKESPTPAPITATAVPWWIFGGGAAGVLMAIAMNPLFGFPDRAEELLPGLALAAAIIAAVYPWIRDGDLPPPLLGLAVLTLLVTLLSSGGIAFSGVAETLWLALALGAVATDRPSDSRSLSRWIGAPLFVFVACLGIAQYQTGYRPILNCQAAMAKARDTLVRHNGPELMHFVEQAMLADPWASEPRHYLAQMSLDRWRQSGKPGARSEDLVKEFGACSLGWLTVEPRSSIAWQEVGRDWLEIFKDNSQSHAGRQTVKCLRAAVFLYPTSAATKCDLAEALDATGGADEARTVAMQALALDDQMPHVDKKLTAEQRGRADRIIFGKRAADTFK